MSTQNGTQTPSKTTLARAEDARNRAKILAHIDEFCTAFNTAMEKQGLDIVLDPADHKLVIAALKDDKLTGILANIEKHGVHPEQLETAAEAIALTVKDPGRSGVILGALQSGKTGTAFCLLFSAPVQYLLSGIKYAPLFVTTNQNNHLDQTRDSMRGFFSVYGNLTIRRKGVFEADYQRSLIDHFSETSSDFVVMRGEQDEETTLDKYTKKAMSDLFKEEYDEATGINRIVDTLTYKRVKGRTLLSLEDYCNLARENNYAVMMIVDEPQYGAADTFSRKDGTIRECLLSQIFAKVGDDFFDPYSPNIMVGLSATPFDTYGMDDIFTVRQRIGKNYVGPNCFGGEMIDPTAGQRLPALHSFSEISEREGMEHFDDINYLLGFTDKSAIKKRTYTVKDRKGNKRPMTNLERRKLGVDCLRKLIDDELMPRALARDPENGPVGGLLRLANSIDKTDSLLADLEVSGEYNVIRFYTNDEDGGEINVNDIKRRIARATRNDPRPYLVAVIGKGRMGDAFPESCEVGIDLTQNPIDLNAVLQGTYGRQCGYDKFNSTVIMSDRAAHMVREYIRLLGLVPDMNQSRHTDSTRIGGRRTRADSHLLLTDEMMQAEPPDSPIRMLREMVLEHLEDLSSMVTDSPIVPSVRRRRGQRDESRNIELPKLMREAGLAEYIAKRIPEIDPSWAEPPRLLPVGETIEYKPRQAPVEKISYKLDGEDRCEALVRGRRPDADEERNLGRAQVERRAPRGAGFAHAVLPVIVVKKVDRDGNPLPADKYDQPGRFVLDSISLQLREPVLRRWEAGVLNLPSAMHSMAAGRSDNQKVFQLAKAVERSVRKTAKRKADLSRPDIRRQVDEAVAELVAVNRSVSRLLQGLYNPGTHQYAITNGRIVFFRNIDGRQVTDNPDGPAVITFDDPLNVEYRYFHRGREISGPEEYRELEREARGPQQDRREALEFDGAAAEMVLEGPAPGM